MYVMHGSYQFLTEISYKMYTKPLLIAVDIWQNVHTTATIVASYGGNETMITQVCLSSWFLWLEWCFMWEKTQKSDYYTPYVERIGLKIYKSLGA